MKKFLGILLLSAILLPAVIGAQEVYTPPQDFRATIDRIVNVFFTLLVIISVCLFLYGGILFATASGDETKVTNARNILLYAIIGLVIALLARAFQQFLIGTLIQ